MRNKVALALLCAGTALVAGCGRKAPAGQVAATVDGQEITRQEINTELQAANVPPTADKDVAQRALLQRIIERKLLVKAAEDKGLDKTPDYLAQKRRLDEALLAETYAKQQLAAVPVPSQADIDAFMAQHANAFGKRQQLVLDQIRFPTPPNLKALAALEQDHTQEAVGATLAKLGIKFERGNAGLDTANVPSPIMAQIEKLPPGEPFVIPQPGIVTVNVIKDRRPIAVDLAKARPQAAAAWRQQRFGELLNKQIASLKAGAKVSYQNGFAPPAPGAPGAAAGPAAATPKS